MNKPRNPFILGHRISRPFFCDRENEQKALTSAIINGRNVVLISPRRMGKTSLAYVSISDSEEITNDYITFFIDILQTGSLAEFTFLLGKVVFDTLAAKSETRVRGFLAALKSLKGSFGFDAISGTPTFNIQLGDIKHPEYTLDEIFSYIEQCEKPVVIVIDEFQQITKYPEKNVEALLRSHIQRLSNASFVFAGSERTILQEMFASSKRPFYNSAEIMHLGPIDEDIYVNFAQKQFSDYGKSLEDAPVRLAFQLFEGNTFYMQRAMNIAFAETSRDDVCGEETIRRAIKTMVAANDVVFREILSNMSVHQKLTLYSIASERSVVNPLSGKFVKDHSLPSASSVQSALLKLTKSGIVTKTESGYIMTDPLFRIFINGEYSVPEI
ncbi:MAG: ATP-binding protein [Muribaculaceae bacterium]|nr:ATP-binding protein [Muribaculaceae bacterium]